MTPGDYTTVTEWCGGDPEDRPFGVCCYVMFGNWQTLWTGQVMMAGEIQRAASMLSGFIARQPETDRGIAVQVMLDDIMQHGWPGDSSLKPVSWRPSTDLDATVARYGCAMTWIMLPMLGGDWCFTDAAVVNSVNGTGAHAVLVVHADEDAVTFVTWGFVQRVSRNWWNLYVRGCFEVIHPAWAARMVAASKII